MTRFLIVVLTLLTLTACKGDAPTAQRVTSPNGADFTLITLPGHEDISIQIAWPTDWGYRETKKAAPVVGTQLILAGGAEGYPAGDVVERFADLGSEGQLYVAVNDHIIGELTLAKEHLSETIEIANAHLREPTLDEMWFGRIRDGISQSMAEARAQSTHAGFDASRWAIFGNAPLRNALSLDEPETFASLTREDIVAWHSETFTQNPEAIAITGDLSIEEAGEAVDILLAGLPPASGGIDRRVELDMTPRRILLHIPSAEVTSLSFIAPLPPTRDGGEMEDLILVDALGGGDQGVLFDAVRTELRASYAFGAGIANYTRDHRILFMSGQVDPEKVADAEAAIRQAYNAFLTEGPSGPLEDRKATLAANFSNLSKFAIDQARSELQSALDGFEPGRSLDLTTELEAVSETSVSARLSEHFPAIEAFMVIVVSPNAQALPEACVIQEPWQAKNCP